MTLLFYKIIAGLLIFLATLLSIIYPIKQRKLPRHNTALELADALASGIFLGTALFHMLPDAIAGFSSLKNNLNYPVAELICALGFFLLLFLERLSYFIGPKNHANALSYMVVLILIVHSLIEGAVLGINPTFATALVIFIAIIAHKSSESFALAVILNRSDLSLKKILQLILLFSLMKPFGIAFGTLLTRSLKNEDWLIAGFNAFAAGTFLYMSTLHHINHHHKEDEKEGLGELGALFAGLVIMGVLAFWA